MNSLFGLVISDEGKKFYNSDTWFLELALLSILSESIVSKFVRKIVVEIELVRVFWPKRRNVVDVFRWIVGRRLSIKTVRPFCVADAEILKYFFFIKGTRLNTFNAYTFSFWIDKGDK